MKRIGAFFCVLALMLGMIQVVPAGAVEYGAELNPNEKTYEQKFSDVPKDHWAFKYIAELVERGAINGYPDGRFYPDKTVTREEFAKIMVVAAGLTAKPVDVGSFADVPVTHWASPFIETAKSYITAYRSNGQYYFKPTDGALREDIAVAVVRLKGYDTRLADLSMIQAMFVDVDSISASAQPYVALAVENGIISGYPDRTFRGQDTIARSEAAAILWRAFQYGNDNKVIPGDEVNVPIVMPTPAPTATPEPTTPPAPVKAEKPYQMDTIAEGVGDLRSMVMTNAGTVFYATGTAVYNSKNDTVIDLRSKDLAYKLEVDDKNREFGIKDSICLAYDRYHDRVYLFGNDTGRRLVLYDITDPSTPEMLISRDNFSGILSPITAGYSRDGMSCPVKVLPNGNLILEDEWDERYSLNPGTGAVTKGTAYKLETYLVGTKEVTADYGGMTVKDVLTGQTQTVSVEGYFPEENANNIAAGAERIYVWDKAEGLLSWDLEGWKEITIPAEDIEVLDFKAFPSNVWYLVVNDSNTCAIYDNTGKDIRVIHEAQ